MNPSSDAWVRESMVVQLWAARLDDASHELGLEALTADEKTRASRFRFERDRRRFVAARAVLRRLLSRYVGCPPQDVPLATGANGKPILGAPLAGSSLAFNLSHSTDVALYAFADAAGVGVDVEAIRAEAVEPTLSHLAFSADEMEFLRSLDRDSRTATFFAWWVRKEAAAKVTGEGLGAPLNRFRMPLRAFAGCDAIEMGALQVLDVELGAGLAAAVAVPGRGWRTAHVRWVEGSVLH